MVENSIANVDTEIIDVAKKYAEVVKRNYDVSAIFLYGSYAKGTAYKDSDIDIAIVTDDIKTDRSYERINLRMLRWNIDHRIEPHLITVSDFENDETPFEVEVKNTGIRIV